MLDRGPNTEIPANLTSLPVRTCSLASALVISCTLTMFAGCSSPSIPVGTGGKPLTLRDFVDNNAVLIPVENAPPVRPITPDRITGPFAASGGVLDITAVPGRPSDAASLSTLTEKGADDSSNAASGSLTSTVVSTTTSSVPLSVTSSTPASASDSNTVMIDVKVGDINGKPLFANEFFEPFADRLRAEAARMRRDQWRTSTRQQIQTKLDELIEAELLRAEALEALEPEEKAGFFAFMRQVQDRIESQNMGSREAANERLVATEGKSLDAYMREEERRQLVDIQVREKIQKRVSVPWRDVRQEYDRFYETFNPPPVLTYRLIQIAKDKPEKLAEFQKLRDAGTPFDKIATNKDVNGYKADSGGLEERQLKGEREQASLFGNAQLNKAAQTLSVGSISEPITVGDNISYLYLEKIDQQSKSLYEAQVLIENVLRESRTKTARAKYINRLRERASISDTTEMTRQLLTIAEARYWSVDKRP